MTWIMTWYVDGMTYRRHSMTYRDMDHVDMTYRDMDHDDTTYRDIDHVDMTYRAIRHTVTWIMSI